MKSLYPLLLLSVTLLSETFVQAQQTPIPLRDSTYTYNWITDVGNWQPYFKYLYNYDQYAHTTAENWHSWNYTQHAWEPFSKTTNTYNDTTNTLTSTYIEYWFAATQTWTNNYHNTYTYDAYNQLITLYVESWDGSTWKPSTQSTYTYNDNRVATIIQKGWNPYLNQWVNNIKIDYTYNPTTHVVETQTTTQWNPIQQIWIPFSRTLYTYNPDGTLLSTIGQGWNGAAWQPNTRILYSYTPDTHIDQILSQNWNGTMFQDNSKNSHTYDGDYNLVGELFETWYADTWSNSGKYVHYYSTHEVSSTTNTADTFIHLFPNPTKATLHITSTLEPIHALQVWSAQGTLMIEQKQLTSDMLLNTDQLAAGHYILRLQTAKGVIVKTFVKTH